MKMRKIIVLILTATLLFGVVVNVNAETAPRVRIDGEFIDTGDQQAVIVDGRTLVPLRAVMEALGFNVEWHQASSNARLIRADDIVSITIDQNVMFVNGRSVSLDVPARIINNRTMVPVRAISEATGMRVEWDGANLIVDVRTVNVMTLPNRRLTDEELQQWIEVYNYNGGANEFELEVVRLINIERANHGLSPLTIDGQLMLAARFKSQEMSDLDYYAHHSPVYGSFNGIVRLFGSEARAELLTRRSTPDGAVNAWMNSAGHRANVLREDIEIIGIGQFDNFVTMLVR